MLDALIPGIDTSIGIFHLQGKKILQNFNEKVRVF